MLQTIREHTQGWIAGTIISVIIMSFALWGIHSYFVSGGNSSIVAQVNGIDITREQLSVAYERLRRQVITQYGSNSQVAANDAALKDRALRDLIDVEVLKQASSDQGFKISNHQVDNYLQNMPEFQVNGQFSMERFQEILSATLLSTGEFLDLIKTSLLMQQPKLGVVFSSFALPDETDYTIGLVNQERDISYITIPMQYFYSQPITISADSIKNYYEQHQNDFMTPEQVNVEYLQLALKDLSVKINPTDVMLKSFYNENINAYTQPMSWKLVEVEIPVATTASPDEVAKVQGQAEAVVDALKKGGDPAKIAQQYSGTMTAQDWMTLNQIPAELQKASAELTKPGQVSDVIRTPKGYAVVRIVDVKPPKMQPFDSVKDKVKETYVHQHAEEKFAEIRDRLADSTYEHPESLQFASKTLGLPILTSESFTKDKAGKDISQYKKVRDVAFSNDVMNLQNNSDVIQLNPETVIVLRVKSHVASTLLPLSGISKQIADKLKAEEAEKRAAQFAEEFKKKLQTGADPQALANQYKFTWVKAGSIGRYSTKVDNAVLDVAFRLPNPSQNQNKTVYGITRLSTGFAVVALNAVKSGVSANPKQASIFAEQVQNSEGLIEYELYKQSQSLKTKIDIQQQ